ncbi:MAG: shikimate kinase [Owenweeksia sp.]
MKISLTGYMGAGKSTIGQKLALETGLDFYDLDTEIEKDTGYTITETIFNKGELYFRELEHKKLQALLQKNNMILSTGGGTPCYYDNMDLINKSSFSVYLKYSVKELYNRLEGKQSERPLLAHLNGQQLQEYIGKHLFERNIYYEKATVVLPSGSLTDQEIVNKIKELINE